MRVNSELLGAQLENLGSDVTPASTDKGRIYHKSTTEPIKVSDGTTVHKVLTDQMYSEIHTGLAPMAPELWSLLHLGGGLFITDDAAGTYFLGNGLFPSTSGISVSGSHHMTPIYLAAADFPSVTAKTLKLRIRGEAHANDVASARNFVIGLYPLTRPSTSGGNQALIFTPGTVISGSEVTFNAPAADSSTSSVSTEFDLPTDGFYAVCVTLSGLIPANAAVYVSAKLQYIYT